MPDTTANTSQVAFSALLALHEVTRCVKPAVPRSLAAPRSFAPWFRQERQLLSALQYAGIEEEHIAWLLQRTPEGIRLQVQRGGAPQEGQEPRSIRALPHSSLPLTPADVNLLGQWTAPPLRDPFGFRVGMPLPADWSAEADSPALRVILARPDGTLDTSELSDYQGAAQAVWTDLAARVVQQPKGGVLLHGPDAHGRRQQALRDTLRRVNGRAAGRGRVLDWCERRATPTWTSVIIADPERWFRESVGALARYAAVILVLPDYRHALEQPGLLHSGPLTLGRSPQTLLTEQEALVARWSAGRTVEPHVWTGVPNSHCAVARLDWPALSVIPSQGELLCAREDLLIRASVWISLAQSVRVPLPDPIRTRYGEMLECINAYRVPREIAVSRLQHEAAKIHPDLTAEERVLLRALLDTFYPVGAATSDAMRPPTSSLTLTLGPVPALTYIGR